MSFGGGDDGPDFDEEASGVQDQYLHHIINQAETSTKVAATCHAPQEEALWYDVSATRVSGNIVVLARNILRLEREREKYSSVMHSNNYANLDYDSFEGVIAEDLIFFDPEDSNYSACSEIDKSDDPLIHEGVVAEMNLCSQCMMSRIHWCPAGTLTM